MDWLFSLQKTVYVPPVGETDDRQNVKKTASSDFEKVSL